MNWDFDDTLYRKEWEDFHASSIRKRIRLLFWVRWVIEVAAGFKTRRGLRKMLKARHLTISNLNPVPEMSTHVEVRIMAGKVSIPLHITTIAHLKEANERDWAIPRQTSLSDFEILVPFRVLTDELVVEAIRKWYFSLVEWKHGHWTYAEKKLPEFTSSLVWMHPEGKVSARELRHLKQEKLQSLANSSTLNCYLPL